MVAWVLNVCAQPEVTLRRGRRTETLRAEEVGSEAAGLVLQRYVRNVRVTAPFFDAKRDDPVERFVEEAPAIRCSSSSLGQPSELPGKRPAARRDDGWRHRPGMHRLRPVCRPSS